MKNVNVNNPNQKLKNLLFVTPSSLLVLGILAGCNQSKSLSSNPLEGRDLGTLTKPHTVQPRKQEVLDGSYVIDVERDVTFVEGEMKTFKIRARVFHDVDSFDLVLKEGPDEPKMIMAKSKDEPGTWLVSWAPQKGFIAGDKIEKSVRFKIEIGNIKSKDSKVVEIFNMINRVQESEVKVRRTGKSPVVVADKIPTEVAQGAVVPFAIEVDDPASYEGFSPRVDIYFQGTNQTEGGFEANGATYVRIEKLPKFLGNGKWRFDYVFDAKNNDVGAQLDRSGKRVDGAEFLQARFFVKAYGATGVPSAESMSNVKIKFIKPQTAIAEGLEQAKCGVRQAPAAAKPNSAAKPAVTVPPAATASGPATGATVKPAASAASAPAVKAAASAASAAASAAKPAASSSVSGKLIIRQSAAPASAASGSNP